MHELATAFESQASRVGAVVHRARRDDAATRAAEILEGAGCGTVALPDGRPEAETFRGALEAIGLTPVSAQAIRPTQRADGGISFATLGVAETGSVLLHSTSGDRRVELCVDVHLVVLDVAAVAPTLDVAMRALRDIAARPPAYASLVSGPSRSADIERQITIGVHGPRALFVLLLEEPS